MVHDLEWVTAVMHGWQQHLLLIIIRINTPGYFLWKIMCYFMFTFFLRLGLFVFNIKKLHFSQHGKKLGKQSNWRSHF